MPLSLPRFRVLGAAVSLSLLGATAFAGGLPPAPAPLGAIFALPPLAGQNASAAVAISENGRAAGTSAPEDPETGEAGPLAPVLWANRRPGLLGLPPGAVEGLASAVDDLNRAAGTVNFGDDLGRAVLWVGNRPRLLPQPPGTDAEIRRLTPQGVVGGNLTLPDDTDRAVVWQGNRLVPLPPLPGHTETLLGGINFRLQAAGASGSEDGGIAVVWQGNRTTPLPLPPGATSSAALDINDNGVVVGIVGDPEAETSAVVLWSGRRIQVLPTPPDSLVIPLDINNRGDVVGVEAFPDLLSNAAQAARSVLRRPEEGGVGALGFGGEFFGGIVWLRGQPFLVDEFLPPNSGWSDLVPLAINNRRQVVGTGIFNDEPRGFIMNLPQNL